jgi:hypothetical protein
MSPGNKVDPSYAESVMLKAGLKPLEPFKSSTTKWKCLHLACGEIVSPQYHQIQRGQGGCLSCGRKRTAESQRIPEDDAIKMMMGANLKPKTKFPGAKIPWKCECLKCKKIVSIGNRHYSMRGPLGKDMNNGELLRKLLKMKQK